MTEVIHYLDDFFIVAASKEECQAKVDAVTIQMYGNYLGIVFLVH